MNRKWLALFVSLIVFVVLSACGDTAPSNQQAAEQEAPSQAPTESTATDTGTAAHDANAKIASMSIHITNNLLALGIKPAGSVVGGDAKDFLPHVVDQLQGVAKLGVVTDPDMESVLALKPDVIYLDEVYSGDDQAKFEKIAPSISIDMDQGTWRDHLNRIAQHVGKEKEAEAFIKEYADQAEHVQTLIHTELGKDAKVMAIRMTAKELRVMGMKRPLGPILFEDLALNPAAGVEKITEEPYAVISQEVLPDFDADAIFVIISKGSEAKARFDELATNRVWQNLKAVKNNHVYVLDGQKWLDYSSIGHRMALDDAEKLFAK
ncbi:iron complex transport system substrate-binding protein [Paenibacillus endophyticus]|uniref:Iron complex transport system substrate-binding protein n=1 Tax=Paenibacillus endophyticus TaxID=1294268 RepID=A0A7W5C8T3_9BACL|nr:ABC transporter substrate-binding protein [Paenibacillus endophyticus]MBB3153112.1 iron complex transport system substrate-binding protein [Paenibacillus endophyticus]